MPIFRVGQADMDTKSAAAGLGRGGLFADAERETAFLRDEWPQLGARVRAVGLYGSLAFVSAAVTDATALGFAPVFWALLAARLGVLAWGLWLARAGRQPLRHPRRVIGSLLGFEVAILTLFLLVVLAYGGSADYHTITALALVFAVYAYVPLLTPLNLWLGVAFSLGFGVVVATSLHADANYVPIAITLFSFANIAGWQIAVNQARGLRLSWLDRQRLVEKAQQAQRAQRLAQQGEDNLLRLFDAAPVPMLRSRRADGKVLRLNRALRTLLDPRGDGGRDGEVLRTLDFYVDPADRGRLLQVLERQGGVHQAEVRLRRLDGSEVDVLVSAQPLEIEGQACVISGLTDIGPLKAMERQLRGMAYTDALTGVDNRRAFFERAQSLLAHTRAVGEPFGLLLLDLDRFKSINDRYGHPGGDAMLVEFARVARALLRDADAFARVGGEEFAALLPGASVQQAWEVAERLREFVAAHPFALPGGEVARLTVSIGVAAADTATASVDALVLEADRAVYRAKSGGRNRTEVAGVMTAG